MGNKFSRRRAVVDERYTRTQGLYQHRDVDPRKLRRLILNGQLAPCFPGAEDSTLELDECPICFLFYPSLNRSKCCTKGICTECFLQIKSPHSARPTQCPFCKTSSYVVEYRGAKTVEEKGVEQAEEQKVIEAKIRIRQKELLDEEERMLRQEEDQGQNTVPDRLRRNFSNLHGFTLPSDGLQEVQRMTSANEQDAGSDTDSVPAIQPVQTSQLESVTRQIAGPQIGTEPAPEGAACTASQASRLGGSTFHRLNRVEDFDLDLEEIMVMEAIWLSIQEQGQTLANRPQLRRVLNNARSALDENSVTENVAPVLQESHETQLSIGRSSVTSGLAGAIAALAERQATSSESIPTGSNEPSNVNAPQRRVPLSATGINGGEQRQTEEKHQTGEVTSLNNWIEVSVESGRTFSSLGGEESRTSLSDWLQDHSSEAVEVGTSVSSSVPSASDLPWDGPDFLPPHSIENIDRPPGLTQPTVMLPDSFEEQMMLAMALSLAEAQAQALRE
ncbi:hypothetical protein GOP47_0019006 [Adiantum capillus-veneris]|uniref:RING-type domain-containing protein n=1 Tax=Adiantum capillus-veneris TaxID=13818 RepID=A0A9D4ZA49_ADICA|nr:hypothetical protein GOP47_0019006 [Adiantum capillus-veneris]